MARLMLAIVMGLVGAGIVHIAVTILIPFYSQNDAWNRLGQLNADYVFKIVESPAGPSATPFVKTFDPLFSVAACRFNLESGLVRISNDGKVPFWSVSVFDQAGQNAYSLNDRNATDGRLDIVIATPLQMIELRKDLPEEYQRSILVEAPISAGMAVLRVFNPDPSWARITRSFLEKAACESE